MSESCGWPTPRQFVDEWEARTDEERLEAAEVIIAAGKDAARCHALHAPSAD